MPRFTTRVRLPDTDTSSSTALEDESVSQAATRITDLNSLLGEGRLRRVLQMIESHPCRSVSELAQEVHLTPAHLQRLFKQKMGVHVSALIVEQRLQKAAILLATSDLPIKEIAHTVGYEHHSSFVRSFQRRFAQSPKHYRRHIDTAQPETPSIHL
jgi:AraC-like DNA-binding protein